MENQTIRTGFNPNHYQLYRESWSSAVFKINKPFARTGRLISRSWRRPSWRRSDRSPAGRQLSCRLSAHAHGTMDVASVASSSGMTPSFLPFLDSPSRLSLAPGASHVIVSARGHELGPGSVVQRGRIPGYSVQRGGIPRDYARPMRAAPLTLYEDDLRLPPLFSSQVQAAQSVVDANVSGHWAVRRISQI